MSMADHGLMWTSMDLRCRGLTWIIVDQCGLAWMHGAVDDHTLSWISMDLYGLS